MRSPKSSRNKDGPCVADRHTARDCLYTSVRELQVPKFASIDCLSNLKTAIKLLFMADEPSLPPLVWNPVTESFAEQRASKRVRRESPIISSDPPLFSSDDDPSLDNYTRSRCKQTYRGPWYSRRPDSNQESQRTSDKPKRSKRTFERQFDSGVWLGSDETDLDEPIEGLQTADETWNLPVRQSQATQTKDAPPSPLALAQGQIEMCLEDGNESIDLSYVAGPDTET